MQPVLPPPSHSINRAYELHEAPPRRPQAKRGKFAFSGSYPIPELDVQRAIEIYRGKTSAQLITYLNTNQDIIVSQDIFTKLFPKSFVAKAQGRNGSGDPNLWQTDPDFTPELIDALLKALREGRVVGMISHEGKFYKKLAYTSGFEEKLHATNLDYDKSQIIAMAFSRHFSHLSPVERAKLQRKLIKYSDYIGVRKDHIVKILTRSKDTAKIFKTLEGKQALANFTHEVANQMSRLITLCIEEGDAIRNEAGQPPVNPLTVVITTTSSGGAHRSIASVIDDNLKKREIPHVLVNESELVPHDKLEVFVGLPRSDMFNKVSQQSGQMAYGKKMKLLDDAISQFKIDDYMNELRKAVGKSALIVSTSHHPENVRLVAESAHRICFQVCDFGSIPDKIEKIAKTTAKYNLTGITFFMPSESSTLKVSKKIEMSAVPGTKKLKRTDSKSSNKELAQRMKAYEHFAHVQRYPVHEAFTKQVNLNEVRALKDKLQLRHDAEHWVITMGSQGVGSIIRDNIDDVLIHSLWDLEQGRLDNLDVAILCGSNEQLRKDLEIYCKNKMLELCGGETDRYQLFTSKLTFKPLPKLTLPEVALLGKTCGAFLTKPGGGTSAEGLYGGFPMIIHKEENHPWEFGNIEELVQNNATVLAPGQSFYKAAKHAQRTRAPNLSAPEDCVEYAIEVLWKIEESTLTMHDILEERHSLHPPTRQGT